MATKISPGKLPVSLETRLELLHSTRVDFIAEIVIRGAGD